LETTNTITQWPLSRTHVLRG